MHFKLTSQQSENTTETLPRPGGCGNGRSAAGLVEMEVPKCLGAALVCLACVGTRLLWVLNKVAAPVEKRFGPSEVPGKSDGEAGSAV